MPMCPRCRTHVDDLPALSRRDNRTLICRTCGRLEATFDVARGHLALQLSDIRLTLDAISANLYPVGEPGFDAPLGRAITAIDEALAFVRKRGPIPGYFRNRAV